MARRRKKAVSAPTGESPAARAAATVATDLGSLLKAAMEAKAAASSGGESPGPPDAPAPLEQPRPGRHSRTPPVQAPPGPEPLKPVPAPGGSPQSPPGQDSPPQPIDPADLRRLNDAYRGVTPLRGPGSRRAASPGHRAPSRRQGPSDQRLAQDAAARERLGALVGGGLRFTIERDEDGRVAGLRQGAPRSLLRTLRSAKCPAEAEVDLHGLRSVEAAAEVVRFVRTRYRGGARTLLIVHGAGRHSEGGQSVLRECTVEALTRGGAAPLVQAFATAHERRGGLGALVVYLK